MGKDDNEPAVDLTTLLGGSVAKVQDMKELKELVTGGLQDFITKQVDASQAEFTKLHAEMDELRGWVNSEILGINNKIGDFIARIDDLAIEVKKINLRVENLQMR